MTIRRAGSLHPPVVGASALRLLERLSKPRRGQDLAAEFGLSRQRIHQIIRQLWAAELIRFGDAERPFTIIARVEDPTFLLTYREQRILSSFSPDTETIARLIATALNLSFEDVETGLAVLGEQRFVRQDGASAKGIRWCLTPMGLDHPQYRPEGKKSAEASLSVKSDRVANVLSYLARHGPSRMYELRDSLAIPHNSANALMQYLKRKGLIRKIQASFQAPFELTDEGRRSQRGMDRKAREASA